VQESAQAFAKEKRDKRVESIISLKASTDAAVSEVKVD
jgi:hypothetical protein